MTGFALRTPWYERERLRDREGNGNPQKLTLRSPAARRPVIQMYDTPRFVDELLHDPAHSLAFGADDVWTYPVPVKPTIDKDKPRLALATSRLVTTNLRKLYQPLHQRFYVVVVEVFCDSPGLPRAGDHKDITVEFRMRRMHTSLTAKGRPARRVAADLVHELAKEQKIVPSRLSRDVRDVWWADRAWRCQFAEDHKDELSAIDCDTDYQQWLISPKGGGRWRTLCDEPDPVRDGEREETFPMWRLPVRTVDADKKCTGPETRSLWFGVIPTFSGEHWLAPQRTRKPPVVKAKLDERAIYEIECLVLQPRPNCPPVIAGVSAPTEPFRLADPMDPAGTKNRTVTITLPDLRRLAARAGEKQGPGGVRIVTPPDSQLKINPFATDNTKPGSGRVGAGGAVCTFALELFFLVAFFLFLMFLPIVVLIFQLWWLLALRFCIPPRIGFDAAADFFATGNLGANARLRAEVNLALGSDLRGLDPNDQKPDIVQRLLEAENPDGTAAFDQQSRKALVRSTDPRDAVQPTPATREISPPDPLCRPSDRP